MTSKKIIIFGAHSGKNKGDLAILLSMIKNMHELNKEITFYIPSKDTQRLRRYVKDSKVKIFDVLTGHFGFKIFKYLKNSDLIIFGGGGLFFDRKLFNPFYNHLTNLFFITLLNKLFYKKPIILFSVGSSHLDAYLGKKLMKYILNNSEKIIVRDMQTKNLFSTLSKKKIDIIYDPSFLLEIENSKKTIKNYQNSKKKSIIICFNNSLFKVRQSNNYDNFLNTINELSYKYSITLFQNDSKQDIVRKIKEDLDNNYKISILDDKDFSPYDIINLIKEFDIVVSAPMHFCIFSYIVKKKVIPIIYDEKVLEFCKITGNKKFVYMEEINNLPNIIDSYKQFSQNKMKLIKDNVHKGFLALNNYINNESKK